MLRFEHSLEVEEYPPHICDGPQTMTKRFLLTMGLPPTGQMVTYPNRR